MMRVEKVKLILPHKVNAQMIDALNAAFSDANAKSSLTSKGKPVGSVIEFFAEVSDLKNVQKKIELANHHVVDDWTDTSKNDFRFVVPVQV